MSGHIEIRSEGEFGVFWYCQYWVQERVLKQLMPRIRPVIPAVTDLLQNCLPENFPYCSFCDLTPHEWEILLEALEVIFDEEISKKATGWQYPEYFPRYIFEYSDLMFMMRSDVRAKPWYRQVGTLRINSTAKWDNSLCVVQWVVEHCGAWLINRNRTLAYQLLNIRYSSDSQALDLRGWDAESFCLLIKAVQTLKEYNVQSPRTRPYGVYLVMQTSFHGLEKFLLSDERVVGCM